MIIISPGVYSRELDLSLYVPQLAQSILGLVTTASKGPTNEITLITDENALISTFGIPSAEHLGIYAAIMYLRRGRQLKVIRVADYDQTAEGVIRNDGDTADAVAMSALSTGSWGNNTSVVVSAGTDAGTYRITVLYNGGTTEVYDLLKVGAANVNDSNYIETRINGVSEFISVIADSAQTTLAVSSVAVSLAGGDDGAPADPSDYVGVAGAPPAIPSTGLQLFANPETIDLNLVAVPGITDRSVVSALLTLAENRKDVIALIDVPYGKSVQQAVAWTNGTGGGASDPTAALNSSYAAAFYPWVQIYDGYNDADVWIPPTGVVAGGMAYTDQVADPWFAPAGPTRGKYVDVLDVEHSATQGERDYMYSNGNIVNPIINKVGQGIMLYGQRTTQRADTKLDRINVRRLLNYMEKAIATAVDSLTFDPNDEITWARFRTKVKPIMAEIKGRRGIEEYEVICDASTNTETVRQRNELHGDIMFIPVGAAEMIQLTFVILNSQAQFQELS